jgi:hypothetical protein
MRIVRAEHVYRLPLDLAELARPPHEGGIGAADPGAYRDVPLAALPALLLANPAERRTLQPSELPTRTLPARTTAYVNDGRWIAHCPTIGCGAALIVSPVDPRFLCPTCWQGYYRVEFPSDSEVEKIEALLAERPGPASRHWIPGETLAALRADNKLLRQAAEEGVALDELLARIGGKG